MTQNQKITLASGEELVVLVPDLNNGRELAVVDLGVLQRLADLLPKANAEDIIKEFSNRLYQLSIVNPNMDAYVAELTSELTFHQSVNVIRTYQPEPQPVAGIHDDTFSA